MICRAILYAEACHANILVLIPQWKNSYFYPFVQSFKDDAACKNVFILSGKMMFRAGFDQTTIFSERYDGNVEIWHLDFRLCSDH
jgi:hypothetical protein